MPSTRPIVVAPYSYTAQDAQRTVGALDALWAHHCHASNPDSTWLDRAHQFIGEASRIAWLPPPARRSTNDLIDASDTDHAFGELTAAVSDALPRLDHERIAALLAATWDFFPGLRRLEHSHDGRVVHLAASKGLPKKSIATADIGWRGVKGDVQRARAHHGRPWQALCLWNTDALDTLRSEGHPIAPGFAGENITVEGVPAGAFRPGARFRVGQVEGFLTSYAIPCAKNSAWFADGDFQRIHFERGDQSRIYAMVTATGTMSVGDRFELIGDR